MSATRRFRHRAEYGLVMALRGLFRLMPMPIVRGVGTALGLTFWALDAGHRRLAFRQLQAAFPARSAAECRTIARRTFEHFGRSLTILLKFSTMRPERMRELVTFEGEARAREALEQGRGVLFITGHFGAWELHGICHALILPPTSVLARRLDNPWLHDLLESVRTATGNRVIYRHGAVRRVLRALQQNEGVAILIDQHIQPADAVTVQFFGRPAATTSAVAALALRTGAPVIPVFGVPLADGRFRMVYEHPIEPPVPGTPQPITEFTQRCTDVLEMYVRRHPELWLWMHRRWRDDEPGEPVGGMYPPSADANESLGGDEEGTPTS
ncbi:MAG: lysophospholipid acyltransferase family protein [Vicinamibacterales bacterium]